jgi:hypothetical protein
MADKKSSLLGGFFRFMAKLAGLCLLVMVIVGTFQRAGHAPKHGDVTVLKTIGFWGICAAVFLLSLVFIGVTDIKRYGAARIILVGDIVVCVIIYALMFA